MSDFFPLAYVFELCLHCNVHSYFIPFYGYILFHCIDRTHFKFWFLHILANTCYVPFEKNRSRPSGREVTSHYSLCRDLFGSPLSLTFSLTFKNILKTTTTYVRKKSFFKIIVCNKALTGVHACSGGCQPPEIQMTGQELGLGRSVFPGISQDPGVIYPPNPALEVDIWTSIFSLTLGKSLGP